MTVRIAFKALGRNKMRTVLTMLGMIIGVAAVITMVALGAGAQSQIADQIKGAGTNTITIFPGTVNAGGVQTGAGGNSKLMPADAESLRELPIVAYVAEGIQSRIGGQIYEAKPPTGASNLGPYRGQDSFWAKHEFVVKDGYAYDSWTGPQGEPLQTYMERFEYWDVIDFLPK